MSLRLITGNIRLQGRTFYSLSRVCGSSVSGVGQTPVPVSDKPIGLPAAPNRQQKWSKSQAQRMDAMTGPRFEQTDMNAQVIHITLILKFSSLIFSLNQWRRLNWLMHSQWLKLVGERHVVMVVVELRDIQRYLSIWIVLALNLAVIVAWDSNKKRTINNVWIKRDTTSYQRDWYLYTITTCVYLMLIIYAQHPPPPSAVGWLLGRELPLIGPILIPLV